MLSADLHPEVAKHVLAARLEARKQGAPDPFPRAPLESLDAKRRRVVELAQWFVQVGSAAGWLQQIRALKPGVVTICYPVEWSLVRAELYCVNEAFAFLGLITACSLATESPHATAARWAREVRVLGSQNVSELAAAKAFRDATREPRRSKRSRDRSTKQQACVTRT
jgi:hypothetical protein